MDTESKQLRLSAVGIVAISLFLALFVRLWFLQGIDRQEFEAASVSNRLRVIHEEAPRGRILDRNGKVLVDNRTSIVVALDREPLRKMEPDERSEMFVDLADTLVSFGVPAKVTDIEKAYDDKRYAPQAYVPVAEDVTEDVEIYLAERGDRFPGVVVERKAVRVYPYGNTAVHLLGYVGEINEDELVARGGTVPGTEGATTTTVAEDDMVEVPDGKEYELGDSIGKTGVERSYEGDLRGVPGKRTIEVNAQGDLVDVVSLDPPEAGDDIWLTIDVDLQAHAERLLEAKIQSLRGQLVTDRVGDTARGVVRLNAPQGSVVIQNPANGEINAMASYPDYDPTSVVNGISQDLWTVLNDPNSGQPLVNWALQGTYAPGSTFKLFTAVAAQRTGLLPGGDEVVNDPGYYNVENCTGETCEVQNAGRTPHGAVNLAESMTVSSDVYYYRIADKFWNRRGEFGETPDPGRRCGVRHGRHDRHRAAGREPWSAAHAPAAQGGLRGPPRPVHDGGVEVRRQHQHVDRPGRRARHPVAARGRVLHLRQRRHPLPAAGRHPGDPHPRRDQAPGRARATTSWCVRSSRSWRAR